MGWTYGFFNDVNGDRLYNAFQISALFEGIITDGVFESVANKLAVSPNNGMSIQIDTGRGWFKRHWVNNDTPFVVTVAGSDVVLNRYCAVCIRVDDTDALRNAVPYLKYSDFATNPVKPQPTRSEFINEYVLAYIYIPAKATEIKAQNIEDTRFNTDLCGWVTGVVSQIDRNTIYTQQDALFNEWFRGLQDIIDEDVETTLVDALPKTVTITLNAGDWSNNEQSVVITGMNTTKSILVTPADGSGDKYLKAGIKCIEQSTNSIKFSCVTTPTDTITVEVLHMGV